MRRTYEAQWDRERQTVTLVAQSEFGGDRYVIVRPAATQEEADAEKRAFVAMYTNIEEETTT